MEGRLPSIDGETARCSAWGFNTIGNWSENRLCELHRIPYTRAISVFELTYKKPGEIDFVGVPHFGNGQYQFADIFAPLFRKHLLATNGVFADLPTHEVSLDPWCLGVFVDNELPWSAGQLAEKHGLVRTILEKPGPAAVKKAFWKRLSQYYGSIAALNAAWGSKLSVSRFEDLMNKAVILPAIENDSMRKDLEDLTGFYAEHYFSTVRKVFRRYLPNTLYLGSRFDAWTPQAVKNVSARYMDVVSFNVYDRNLGHARYATVPYDKPMLVSEFHFGATDRGAIRGGIVTVRNQKKRAKVYVKFAQSVLDNSSFVGFHWFQYADEPVTGRYGDGENFNCGLVDVMDIPYPELTEAAAKFNRLVYKKIKA